MYNVFMGKEALTALGIPPVALSRDERRAIQQARSVLLDLHSNPSELSDLEPHVRYNWAKGRKHDSDIKAAYIVLNDLLAMYPEVDDYDDAIAWAHRNQRAQDAKA